MAALSRVRASRLLAAVLLALTAAGAGIGPARAARNDVRILVSTPSGLDPAAQGDIGSAWMTAQLFESLTAIDRELRVQPALAASWEVADGGKRVTFHLRPGLAFSDGTPIAAEDVVASWLRLLDPGSPSPLASLMLDVTGARARLAGTASAGAVGIRAEGADVVVTLDRANADFPAIVASPSFGVVPAAIRRDPSRFSQPTTLVVSGGYRVASVTADEFVLQANPRYWAGTPAIGTVHAVMSIGGRSPVAAFEDGTVDYAPIGWSDAGWIAYDPALGPSLRRFPQLALSYLGFDTGHAPFDDARVRQAFAAAVDWRRIVELSGEGEVPADAIVPEGTPGRPEGGFLPAHDPAKARELLAAAGFPGGAGFPTVAFATGGLPEATAIAADLQRVLGVRIELEARSDHFDRLATDPAPMWTLGWVADYPGANDFLGVLLGTGAATNYGRWSDAAFDAAIEAALSSADVAGATAAYGRALAEVRDQAPVIPLSTSDAWALSRSGLLGAGETGLGLMRLAGLAWAAGS